MRALAVSEGWGGVNLVAKTLPRRVFTKRICLDAPPSSASFPGLLHLHPRFPKPPFRSGDGQRGFEPDILLLQVSGAKIKRLNILWYLRRLRDRVFLSKAFPSARKASTKWVPYLYTRTAYHTVLTVSLVFVLPVRYVQGSEDVMRKLSTNADVGSFFFWLSSSPLLFFSCLSICVYMWFPHPSLSLHIGNYLMQAEMEMSV